ncbi:class I SAM-dependent methyltransferase [Ferrimonas balearica]|uniref:class I SAM-dependent methyltransferase n=1 Tax=Ferrimonas balearica TaxID=44012 RepID=UPI002D7E4FF6|nr:class I SAM-dependent methyltransferase [Ferrimonas balearica]MBY6019012.1 class I SAM-dependent methyltransferase [Halomonas denitrificans]MBY6095614.1 class I SAM-dependent methyltransferase [Ferrimonas balearica]
MKLNIVEKVLVNNPLRALAQRHFEVPRLKALGGPCPGAVALEIGGGQGEGARLIQSEFGAQQVISLDLDFDMVSRARQRLGERDDILCLQADCTALPLADASVDALFDFGVVHHVPHWPAAIVELNRVARPGATLYAMEVYRSLICHPVWKRVLEHPQHNRFDQDEFIAAWQAHGWTLLGQKRLGSGLGWLAMQKERHPAALDKAQCA